MGNCLTIAFMGDLDEAVSDTFRGNPPNEQTHTNFIRKSEDFLNPDATERQFGNVNVYDASAISPTTDKISGSLSFTAKKSRRKGKGACGKGKGEEIAQN